MTKTIGLSDDAYERLAALKGDDESFSDVVFRLTGAPLIRKMVGSMDDETAQHYRTVVERSRRRQDQSRRERVEDLVEETQEG